VRLHEYQSKELLRKYGVQTPRGYPCFDLREVEKAAKRLGKVLVKPQIHLGEASACLQSPMATSRTEARACGEQIFTQPVGPRAATVRRILVEEIVAGVARFGLRVTGGDSPSITVAVFTLGAQGSSDALLHEENIPTAEGMNESRAFAIIDKLAIPDAARQSALAMIMGVARMAIERGAAVLEINPVVLSERQVLTAVGVVANFTEESLITHPEIGSMRDPDEANHDGRA
jgi:succinyl-CoA synthetase beta subunit